MSGFGEFLVVYYIGVGFLSVLGWGILAQQLNEVLTSRQRKRLRRIGHVLLAIGLAHPAIALTGRDVLRQLQYGVGLAKASTPGADAAAVASLLVAGTLAVVFGRL